MDISVTQLTQLFLSICAHAPTHARRVGTTSSRHLTMATLCHRSKSGQNRLVAVAEGQERTPNATGTSASSTEEV